MENKIKMKTKEKKMAKIVWGEVPPFLGWNKIKTLRKNRGITQTQLSAGANVSMAVIYQLELGFEERVTMKTKEKIAKFFECDVEDIFPAEMIGNVPRDEILKNVKNGTWQITK